MTVSIGSGGSGMGPVGALENFGGNSGGKPFDRRVLLRLLAFLKPHWRRLLLALAGDAGHLRIVTARAVPDQGRDRHQHQRGRR